MGTPSSGIVYRIVIMVGEMVSSVCLFNTFGVSVEIALIEDHGKPVNARPKHSAHAKPPRR